MTRTAAQQHSFQHFTGASLMPLRAWNADLVQALRAKAGLGMELVGRFSQKEIPRVKRVIKIYTCNVTICNY